MRRYGLGDVYNKRVPGMYHFYREELRSAYSMDDVKQVEYLIKDLPKDIYLALVRAGEIETSVDKSREELHLNPEEIIRGVLLALERKDLLIQWPTNEDVERIKTEVLDTIATNIGKEGHE